MSTHVNYFNKRKVQVILIFLYCVVYTDQHMAFQIIPSTENSHCQLMKIFMLFSFEATVLDRLDQLYLFVFFCLTSHNWSHSAVNTNVITGTANVLSNPTPLVIDVAF